MAEMTEENTLVDIIYVNDKYEDKLKLTGIEGFTRFLSKQLRCYVFGTHEKTLRSNEEVVATFRLGDIRCSLSEEQKKAVEEILGYRLRRIVCYRALSLEEYLK